MAEELVAVRMKLTIDQFALVMELLRDQVYVLPKFYAEQLIASHACDSVSESPRLEAAALAAARRRG